MRYTNLNAWYGTNHTLQDINLNIPANHATALIGPSGCGKSTFVRCLNRMHETNPIARVTGSVRIGDLDIYESAKPVQIRRRVGMVFQRPNPFPTMSIYDNVASGLKLNGYSNRRVLDEIVEKSLKNSALWDEVKDDLKKKSGASLSGGQQQRLCIARALAVDPEVLLDGRAGFGARSGFDLENRRPDLSAQIAVHYCDCDAQHAAGGARRGEDRLLPQWAAWSSSTRRIRSSPIPATSGQRITSRAGSDDTHSISTKPR